MVVADDVDLTEFRDPTGVRHPWETARARTLRAILAAAKLRPQSILDYGCGDGYTGRYLAQHLNATRLVGYDVRGLPEVDAEQRSGATVITVTNDEAELPRRAFDLILLCDVLEHVAADAELLSRVAREFAKPGAYLLLTVPAFQLLFSEHDRALHHCRRYSRQQLVNLVDHVGLGRARDGYFFGSLLLVRAATKLCEQLWGASARHEFGIGRWRHGSFVTQVTETCLVAENLVTLKLRAYRLAIPGLTAWSLCQNAVEGPET